MRFQIVLEFVLKFRSYNRQNKSDISNKEGNKIYFIAKNNSSFMQKNHIALVFAIFFVGIFAVMSYVSASGWIDQNTTVNPGSYYVDSFQFGQTSQNVQFFVSSNTTVDIYILNGTAMGNFLTSGNFPAPNFPNTQLATEWWNLTYIASRYDLNISHYSDGSDFVVFYILVVNTGNDYANIIVRLGYFPVNDLQDNLETFLAQCIHRCLWLRSI